MSNPFESPGTIVDREGRTFFKLKRIGVLSTGLFGGAAGLIFGLLAGLFMLVLFGVSSVFGNNGPNAANQIGAGLGMAVMLPIMYGVFGFIGGVLNAFVYNIVAGVTGGIDMEFARK